MADDAVTAADPTIGEARDDGWRRFSENLRSGDRPTGKAVGCYLFACESMREDGSLYDVVLPGLLNPDFEPSPRLQGNSLRDVVVRVVAWRPLPSPPQRQAISGPPEGSGWTSVLDALPGDEGPYRVQTLWLETGVESVWVTRTGLATFRRSADGSACFRDQPEISRVFAWGPLPEQRESTR